MKRFLIWMLLSVVCLSCSRYNGNLYRIYENNLYGYIDSIGNVIIKPQFKYSSRFQDGVALVISDMSEAFHIDTINTIKIIDGKLTIDSLNKTTRKVNDGIKVQYGYINTQGKIIIDTVQTITLERNNFCIPYSSVEDGFSEFISDSLEFNMIILNELLPFNELFLYQDEQSKLWGYKNSEYETHIMPDYKYAGAFSEGRAIVNFPDTTNSHFESETFGNYGVIDTTGNIIIPTEYAIIFPYNNGYSWSTIFNFQDASLSQELLDRDGNSILGPLPQNGQIKYSNFSDNGWAIVEMNLFSFKFYSFIDVNCQYLTDYNKDGNLDLINETLQDAKSFYENYAPVKFNNKWVFINDECTILSEEYDSTGVFSEGYARVMFDGINDKQWGYIDTTFNLVIPYKFSECSDFHNGLAYFKNVNANSITEGYINKQGTVIWSTVIKSDY